MKKINDDAAFYMYRNHDKLCIINFDEYWVPNDTCIRIIREFQ